MAALFPAPRVLAVTTMNLEGYAQTGRRMIESAAELWAADVRLRVYAEGFGQPPGAFRAQWRDLFAEAKWLRLFLAKCDTWPAACGRPPDRGGGYDFRFDARKFSHKVAAMTAAALELAADPGPIPELFVWLDADTVTHAPVDADWLCGLVPPDALLGWLDRESLYPECGCLIWRPAHPEFAPIMAAFRDMYRHEAVFELPEWHDSYALAAIVRAVHRARPLGIASLSGEAFRHPHPFVNGPLGERLDHAKGPRRKVAGRSHRTDLMRARSEPYWNG